MVMEIVIPQPITAIKKDFHRVVAEVAETGRPVVIGNHSSPVAVLIAWHDYQRLAAEGRTKE